MRDSSHFHLPALAPVPYPAWLASVALAAGRLPRLSAGDSDIALLGAGYENEAALLAAANPNCRIWLIGDRVDAQALDAWQQDGELENLSFVPCAREDLPRLVLPGFDAVLVRSLLNEDGPARRQDLIGWCSETLLAGGLLSLTYDVLPGSAPLLMLRDIALAVTHDMAGDDSERLEDALAYLHGLLVSDAPLMAPEHGLRHRMEHLHEYPPADLRRVLLDPGWTPLHVTELSEQCESVDLAFAGTLRCPGFGIASPPAPFAAMLQASNDLLSAEQHRAFIMNESLRTDLYVAGSMPAQAAGRLQAIELDDGATAAVAEVRDWPAVRQRIETGRTAPAVRQPMALLTSGSSGVGTVAFNRISLEKALAEGRQHALLASPVTGGGILVPVGEPRLLAAFGLGTSGLHLLPGETSPYDRLGLLPGGEAAANDG